jgi:hypothetical protein
MSPNRLLTGEQSKPIGKRHGKGGHVLINLTVPPQMKSALVLSARRHRRSLMEECRYALSRYLHGDLMPSDE